VIVFITVLHVVACIVLIVVVLLQRGKGAEVGAVFGGGGGATVFGSRGAGNFLTKLTSAAAVIFMLTSVSLAYFGQESGQSTLFKDDESPAASEPASPVDETAAPSSSDFEEVTPSRNPEKTATQEKVPEKPQPAEGTSPAP